MEPKTLKKAAKATSGTNPMLDPKEVAVRLNVHPATVQRLIRDGSLPAYLIGARMRIEPSDLDAFLRAARQDGAA